MELSEKIQNLRKQNNLSQEQFAEKLNVSRQAVSKWESGQSVPDVDKIIAMSEIFGISTDYLLKDINDVEDNNRVNKSLFSSFFRYKYNPKQIKRAWIIVNIVYILLFLLSYFYLPFMRKSNFLVTLSFALITNALMFIHYRFGKYLSENPEIRLYITTIFVIVVFVVKFVLENVFTIYS